MIFLAFVLGFGTGKVTLRSWWCARSGQETSGAENIHSTPVTRSEGSSLLSEPEKVFHQNKEKAARLRLGTAVLPPTALQPLHTHTEPVPEPAPGKRNGTCS